MVGVRMRLVVSEQAKILKEDCEYNNERNHNVALNLILNEKKFEIVFEICGPLCMLYLKLR